MLRRDRASVGFDIERRYPTGPPSESPSAGSLRGQNLPGHERVGGFGMVVIVVIIGTVATITPRDSPPAADPPTKFF
jgi:hypothetical protein